MSRRRRVRRPPRCVRRRASTASGTPVFSTYLGGTGSDRGRGITRDGANRLYVIGQTFSADFPSINPVQPKIGGNRDTFVVMLAPPYNAISYATYLGGGHNDDGLGVAADTDWTRLHHRRDDVCVAGSGGRVGRLRDARVERRGRRHDNTTGDGMPDKWETRVLVAKTCSPTTIWTATA